MPMPALPTITSFHPEALGEFFQAINFFTNSGFMASRTWQAANTAVFVPFRVEEPVTILKLWTMNGSTATGNVDIGVYDEVGRRLISAGSTAQSGTNVLQQFDVTDTLIGPGNFYLALVASSTATTFFGYPYSADRAAAQHTAGMRQMASALPLPATATFAVNGSGFPLFGASLRSVI